jgi:hypothetical protein
MPKLLRLLFSYISVTLAMPKLLSFGKAKCHFLYDTFINVFFRKYKENASISLCYLLKNLAFRSLIRNFARIL